MLAAVIVAQIGFLTLPCASAQCGQAPCEFESFQPATGAIATSLTFNTLPTQNQNGFTLTRTTSNGGGTIQYAITRPNGLSALFFTRSRFLSPDALNFSVMATFIGDHGVLFKVLDRTSAQPPATTHLEAVFFNLCDSNASERSLYTHGNYIVNENPNPQFFRNGDSSCLFVPVSTTDVAVQDVFELSVFRADTGEQLCQMADQNGQASDTFSAEIENGQNGDPKNVRIRHRASNGSDVATPSVCFIPVADLAVAPQPLSFGAIVNTATASLPVTLTNTGTDGLKISALAGSAHFSPSGFSCFELAAGDSRQVTIQFTPGGANGPFDELLAITRTPAVGPASVRCTGSGQPPQGNLVVTPQPATFGPIVNNCTQDWQVTFSNSGQLPLTVTNVSASTHFTPIVPGGFFPFILQPGGTRAMSIRFRPNGGNGPFTENLTITRTPAVGAAFVQCTGSAATQAVSVQALQATISERSQGLAVFRVSRTGCLVGSLTVNLSFSGTATPSTTVGHVSPGADYVRLSSTVSISANADHRDVFVAPIDDSIDEPRQSVVVTVLAGTGYVVGQPLTAVVNLIDDDPAPVLTVVGRSFAEGNATSAARIVADVALSAPSELTVSVNWSSLTGFQPGQAPGAFFVSTATEGPQCGSHFDTDFTTSGGGLLWAVGSPLTQTISLPICGAFASEPNETFFIALASPDNATLGSSTTGPSAPGVTICSILNDDVVGGSFAIDPLDATADVHEDVGMAFTWTVPTPLNWHDIQFLNLRIREDDETVIYVHWDEYSNLFSLFDEATGRFSREYDPGSDYRLETSQALLDLSRTSVVGSGPTGPSVTLNLGLSFKPQAAGHDYLVEVAGGNDLGDTSDFAQAGTLTVTSRR